MENKQLNNQTEGNEEIHIPFSPEQEAIFGLANKQLEILKQTLALCVIAEKECYDQYIKNNPNDEIDNCLGRIKNALQPILDEIDRCEPIDDKKASKMPEYKGKPEKQSLVEPLEQVRKLI